MTKITGSLDLPLAKRPPDRTLADWLYAELRGAILAGRLGRGTRLPASRDFARQYSVSRGTVVTVFERLQAEGYVTSRVGSGTWVSDDVSADVADTRSVRPPSAVRRVVASYSRPKAWVEVPVIRGRPFQMRDPALDEFPATLWGRLAARRARAFRSWLRTEDDGRGYRPLREAIAAYLGSSRGVRCSPDHIVIVTGAQQALDLLARLLLRRDEPICVEDPGYFGATIAFGNVGAQIVPIPVDGEGLSVSTGVKACPRPKGVYVTPAHQFPLGMTMSLERRMALLKWASRAGACIIEDDYDSEFRFEGRPVPALHSLDGGSHVILIGSFSKLLFPSLRVGYMVLPASLADHLLAFRFQTDFRSVTFDQAVLCDFIVNGHLGRHLRRMRNVYAERLEALIDAGRTCLQGLLRISPVRAGLYTTGFLENGMTSREAETAAAGRGIETSALDRYTLKCSDPNGVLLGFAAFDDRAIRNAVMELAVALRRKRHQHR